MKPNIGRIVSILVACVMLGAPVLAGGVVARKTPTPPPEPTGTLEVTSLTEIVHGGGQYVRLYDWDSTNEQFEHTWSGTLDSNYDGFVAIGDLDGDGVKEIVASGTQKSGTRKQPVWTYYMKVWWAGDASDSPTLNLDVGSSYMDICDIDGDGTNELLSLSGGLRVWEVTKTGYVEEAHLSLGTGAHYGLAEADADNDGALEILVGFTGDDSIGVVIEYDPTDGYSVSKEIRPDDRNGPIDDLSVGDVDGDGKNEVFGTGYMDGNIYLWRYDSSSGEYEQIWTTQGSEDIESSNDVSDVDGDGICEFMHTKLYDGTLVLYKYDTSKQTFYNVGSYSGTYGGNADSMLSHDWDGDGKAELIDPYNVWEWDGSKMTVIQTLAPASMAAIG